MWERTIIVSLIEVGAEKGGENVGKKGTGDVHNFQLLRKVMESFNNILRIYVPNLKHYFKQIFSYRGYQCLVFLVKTKF